MRTRTTVLLGAGAAVVVLGGAAVVFGPGLYADWSEDRAQAAPTLDATTGSTLDAAALDGTWDVGPGSFAGYRLDEILNGEDVTVTGRTEDVTGSVTLAEGSLTEAEVVVDMTTVATDVANRDAYFRDTAIQVAEHPTATFVLTEPVEVPDAAGSVELAGDLTIRGVSQPVTVDAQIGATGDDVQVVGEIPITFADFGVEAPSLGFVEVEDTGSVEFSLALTQAS
ncbi:YceI family protein [Cellulosimicrobium cellulans]|uniref:YceI family protein n=1 Tax=Cellulosimicrobium cellulans TaxID=1710 RepID=UPI00084945FD|nr:YceI family protein [Cellulosimicrobium cellulans]